ncbi:unnamed protein product [Diamesa hyperborea]
MFSRSATATEQQPWVEIIEPKSKERMYANLKTGTCVWDPPEGVPIKRADSSQWWELFDPKTDRFYYYNVASQKTVWHRPQNCDIIPLAKLQILKQTTDSTVTSNDPKDAPQTIQQRLQQHKRHSESNKTSSSSRRNNNEERVEIRDRSAGSGHSKSNNTGGSFQIQQQRMPAVDDFGVESHNKFCKHSSSSGTGNGGGGGQGTSRNSQKYMDSGKSSDSSLSSVHNYRRIQEGGSLRIASKSSNKYGPDNNYRMLQESSSSHNIPNNQLLAASISNSTDLAAANNKSPSHSTGTPLMKKRLGYEVPGSQGKVRESSKSSKHQSFDYSGNPPQPISLTRSGSFMSPVVAQRPQTQVQRKGSIDGNGGGGNSDDSMHEKYFKSVENTPVSRRRHTTASKVDTTAQSPISPQNQATKSVRPSVLGLESSLTKKSSQKYEPDMINLDVNVKQDRFADKMKLDKGKLSPAGVSGHSANNLRQIQQINQLLKPGTLKSPSSQIETAINVNSLSKNSKSSSLRFPKEQTLDRKMPAGSSGTSTGKSRKNMHTIQHQQPPEGEYDNGNTSPLYTNWDLDNQEHLLPLQHYILEQAKLSGCYGRDEQYDSDSIHSESHSEHSFSGHEPDNEDSDHSDGRGDYLAHYPYEDYGAYRGGPTYYNYEQNFNRNMSKEDISEEVTAKLESLQDQIYSPVKHHPPMLKYSYSPVNPHGPVNPHNQPIGFTQYPFQHSSQSHSFQSNSHRFPEQPPPNQHATSLFSQKGQTKSLLQRFQDQLTTNSGDKIAEMALIKECDIEKFAQENLNLHAKGIFRKKSSVRDMLSWTQDAITRPMLSLARDKAGKKMATEQFKLVQIYMGDRKARAGMSLNSVAMDIILAAVLQPALRDELYVQLCRQTTENPKRESLIRGWELMAVCLSFIPPSPTFQPALLGYMNRHRDPSFAKSFPEIGKWPIHVQISHYATIACRRLERIGSSGKKQAKKPTDEEINQAREQIFRDSMFGNTLTEIMELQKDIFPDKKLPWIQLTLSEQILEMQGKQTEGIFRVPADVDEVTCLKAYVDKWEFPENKGSMDAHAPASLLKLWYRELYDPLIPDGLYDECVATDDPKEVALIIEKLPAINKLVLTYLIHFLQEFSHPEVVVNTKMDSSNLAMVFAPNCLRCTSQDPKMLLENARKEMAFMRTLITNMDTSSVKYAI